MGSQLLSVGFISTVLAKQPPTPTNCNLVNIRWPPNLCSDKWNSSYAKEIFKEIVDLLSRDGLEAGRKSGSNGTTTYSNYNILRFLKCDNEFVRKGKVSR